MAELERLVLLKVLVEESGLLERLELMAYLEQLEHQEHLEHLGRLVLQVHLEVA